MTTTRNELPARREGRTTKQLKLAIGAARTGVRVYYVIRSGKKGIMNQCHHLAKLQGLQPGRGGDSTILIAGGGQIVFTMIEHAPRVRAYMKRGEQLHVDHAAKGQQR